MKNIKNNLKRLGLLALVGFMVGSCEPLVDDYITDFGQGPILAQFESTAADLNIIKDAANTPIDYEVPITFFGGKNVPLDRDIDVTIATSSTSVAKEGTDFELPTTTYTIPAGETKVMASIRILTGALIPFDFKDLVLEITNSSESVSSVNTFTLTLKALDQNTLAGTYLVTEGQYWNSGSQRGNFDNGSRTMTIEAISPGLYRHKGLAFWDDNVFYFTVDGDTGVITVLDKGLDGEPTLLNGSPIMTCAGGKFEMVPCNNETNKSTLMPDGHHVVEITTGYFRGAGATREFYEKMVRQ